MGQLVEGFADEDLPLAKARRNVRGKGAMDVPRDGTGDGNGFAARAIDIAADDLGRGWVALQTFGAAEKVADGVIARQSQGGADLGDGEAGAVHGEGFAGAGIELGAGIHLAASLVS